MFAAICGNLRQIAASCGLNSNSNRNTNKNTNRNTKTKKKKKEKELPVENRSLLQENVQ